jgi:uncharacterized protein (TIGR00369 family)
VNVYICILQNSSMDILSIYNQHNAFGRHLDMQYEIISPGLVHYHLKVTKDLLATKNAAHGGAIAGFMDAIVGVAALSKAIEDEKIVSTIEFKINYLAPALLGDELLGIGEVIQKGNRIIVSKGEIFNQNKQLIATCIATLNAYPVSKSDFFND